LSFSNFAESYFTESLTEAVPNRKPLVTILNLASKQKPFGNVLYSHGYTDNLRSLPFATLPKWHLC